MDHHRRARGARKIRIWKPETNKSVAAREGARVPRLRCELLILPMEI